MFTTTGLILILNTTMILVNLTVLMVNSSHIIKEIKETKGD
jgi:hypothetical protein